MLTEPTLEKLKALRLDALAAAWLAQQQDPALAAVPFDERLGLLVEAEWLARENRHLALGPRPPQHPDHRHDRHREELPRLRPRAAGVPQGLPRPLPPRPAALR